MSAPFAATVRARGSTRLTASRGYFARMSDPALDVVEFVLTTHLYTENRDLDENDDLPPRFRQVFWSDDAADDARAASSGRSRRRARQPAPQRALSTRGTPFPTCSLPSGRNSPARYP